MSGPRHLPFFIDYPRNGDRNGRLQALYDRVEHTCSPGGFSELTIAGTEDELCDWFGGDDSLPLRFVDGDGGLVEVKIETAAGDVVV